MHLFERDIEVAFPPHAPFYLELDAVFSKDGHQWRVPAFWRGGRRWTVRFSAAEPGHYAFRWECDELADALADSDGIATISEYSGSSSLWRHGPIQVSENHRYFEHADGTPFLWLADTLWTGLSDRLGWEDFCELVADRSRKGFSVAQIVAGLVSFTEDPGDPGYANEGGQVWDPDFTSINPAYFDAADRRIDLLIESGIVPAIVGGWRPILARMGIAAMKRHWRYLVARYGALPVVWIVGGELAEGPPGAGRNTPDLLKTEGWTEVAHYLRSIDPHHRPMSAHEVDPPFDSPLKDESLTDFDLFQSGHGGWPSIAGGIAQVTKHYSRTSVVKPIIQGEIGYEQLGDTHYEDFQRAAFWTTMLCGASGFTYGAVGTWEAFTADKPLHKHRFTFVLSQDAMHLPGSTQISYGAQLLRQFPWFEFTPHPEWVSPHGTTLLEPHDGVNAFDIDLIGEFFEPGSSLSPTDERRPRGEWVRKHGTFRLPYAAGVPGEVRLIYIPAFGFHSNFRGLTVHALELGLTYRASYWQPSSGISFDLGLVGNRGLGEPIQAPDQSDLTVCLDISGDASIEARVGADGEHVAASIVGGQLRLTERDRAGQRRELAQADLDEGPRQATLLLSIQGDFAIASIRSAPRSWTTAIVLVTVRDAGQVRISGDTGSEPAFYRPPRPLVTEDLSRDLVDAENRSRGRLVGNGWDDYGRSPIQLLDAYRPDHLPTESGDWLLVLSRVTS